MNTTESVPEPQGDLEGLVSAAFVKAQSEMPTIKFDCTNPFFKSKYASLVAIIRETRPILGKHGLSMHQSASIHDGKVTVVTEVRHTSGQTIPCGSMTMDIGATGKSEAQAAGSLITYLRRYAWQTALGIAADEDDDGNSAPPRQERPRTVRNEYVPEPDPADEAAETDLAPRPNGPTAKEKARMTVLNLLVAAPGQPQRDLVTAYCRLKGMIAPDAQLEEWDSFPDTPRKLKAFGQELVDFGIERQKQAEPDLIP